MGVCFVCVCEMNEIQSGITARKGHGTVLGSIDWRTL